MNSYEFEWKDYSSEYSQIVELLLDKEAIKYTGCDESFESFYSYWLKELGQNNFWSKVIFSDNKLIGVIAFAKAPNNVYTIQEIIVSPSKRGQGYGTKILNELLNFSKDIIGQNIILAEAVIYPENIASQKAFEKAKFVYTGSHPDGDAWYYQYKKAESNKIFGDK